MHFYIILNESFCINNENYSRDNLTFGYSVTSDGRFVTSVNSLNEFPELFIDVPLFIAPITREEFPSLPPKESPPME